MPGIHPTAIVDPRARLADDVDVGPYCVIEGEVEIGAGSRLIAQAHLAGPLKVGKRVLIHPFACIGVPSQDRKLSSGSPGMGTRVGDDNVFREHVTVSAGTTMRVTTMGNNNYLMAGAHVGHDSIVGSGCTFANNTALGGHCEIGDRVNFGGGSMAQQFCRIGRIAFLGGLLGINRDLPPFCMVHRTKTVSSLNLVGLRRAGLRDSIDPLRRAFDLMFRSGLAHPEAIATIRDELADDAPCLEFAEFVETSRQGIVNYVDSRGERWPRRSSRTSHLEEGA